MPLPILSCLHALIGEGDNIHIKRCFVRGDEEEISDLVEGESQQLIENSKSEDNE